MTGTTAPNYALPPFWLDRAQLKMTNSHPVTNEDALLARAQENEVHRAEEDEELLDMITNRYATTK